MPKYGVVSAKPVKGFFVEMLTRDLMVEDAILDLLDNCVDGIIRSLKGKIDGDDPYKGFWANIIVNKDIFSIEDNCGGIPWSEHDRAFRMGRPKITNAIKEEAPWTVGVYGIGMKRAIFKMGKSAKILTENEDDAYEIPISAEWMQSEDDWDLTVNPTKVLRGEGGTTITISELYSEISEHFRAEAFQDELLSTIQKHYSIILQKGFQIKVNSIEVKPKEFVIRFSNEMDEEGNIVRPYIFKSNANDVDVFLAIGLREPIPDAEKTLAEQESVQFSSDYAGWTVICNDRVVLYCNRDELTGWGTAGIPRYHTQFISISGIVEFRGDPKKLPTNTTKRGLNFSSALYQQTLEHMREGMRIFINFTNHWKTREDEAKGKVSSAPSTSFSEIATFAKVKSSEFTSVRTGLVGKQYKPKLPIPPRNVTDLRISYHKEKEAVFKLAEFLLSNINDFKDNEIPRCVGEKSFDFAYKELIEDESNQPK